MKCSIEGYWLTDIHRQEEEVVSGFIFSFTELVEKEVFGMLPKSTDIVIIGTEYSGVGAIDYGTH